MNELIYIALTSVISFTFGALVIILTRKEQSALPPEIKKEQPPKYFKGIKKHDIAQTRKNYLAELVKNEGGEK